MSGSSRSSMDLGLLVLRVGLGIMFVFHGWPKLLGGPETWTGLGGAMGAFGITFAPVFWGLMAALAETVGGFLLAVGILVRPSAFVLFITMVVATAMHASAGHDFLMKTSRPLELAVVFLGLVIGGGGRHVLSRWIKPLSGKWYG